MDRTLLANNWNTLCLPFGMAADQITTAFGAGTRVMTLSGYDNDGTTVTISYANASTMEAGKPYIVKPTVTNPVFTDVTIDKTMHDVTVAGATFKGTYEPVGLTAYDRRKLFLANNMLYYPTANLTVNACRAYLELTDEVPVSASNAPSLVIEFGGTTGITDNKRETITKNHWYTIDGRKLNTKPTTKGVYIHNGRKEVLK